MPSCNGAAMTNHAQRAVLTEQELDHLEIVYKPGYGEFHASNAVLKLIASHRLAHAAHMAELAQFQAIFSDYNMVPPPTIQQARALWNGLRARMVELEREKQSLIDQWHYAATRGADLDYVEENRKLTQQLVTVMAERDEFKEMANWFGNRVRRANIGTKAAPSLRVYIEQLESQLTSRTLTWTLEKPTTPGKAYWWRDLDRLQFARPYVLIEKNGRLDVMPIVGLEAVDPFTSGEWAGPIPMPTEATT